MRTAYILVSASVLFGALAGVDRPAQAGSQASISSDVLPVTAIAAVETALGEDRVVLRGWLEILRSVPRTDGATEIVDLTIERLSLVGASRLGLVTISERANDAARYASNGEIRSKGGSQLFPASHAIELFLDLAVPSSPLGALFLHNEQGLRLSPVDTGNGENLGTWPPLGITYELTNANGCAPFLNEENAEPEVGICVSGLSIEVAPSFVAYSVARGATQLHPADVLSLSPATAQPGQGQAPNVRIPCLNLGLTAAGCQDGSIQDNLDALSFGQSLQAVPEELFFSVAPGATGSEGTAVRSQGQCPPAEPGLSPEPESDIYRSDLSATNEITFDGNGPVGACQAAFPLGLLEAISARDDLNAFELLDASVIDANGDGLPDSTIYFSLDAMSPSLAAFGYAPSDILFTIAGGEPAVYASGSDLGLLPGDDLDALCLSEDGDANYGTSDTLLFSLAPDSPSLGLLGASPGDLLTPGTPPRRVHAAGDLGLLQTDNLNAASCQMFLTAGSGDANCDGMTNSLDAALILQQVAGLLLALPCAQEADVNGGGVTSVDAALVLQLEAGLLERLPVSV